VSQPSNPHSSSRQSPIRPCSQLQDNYTQVWDPEIVVQSVLPYILRYKITLVRCSLFPTELIYDSLSQLLTFDHMGVSSHPNHYSLYYATRRLLASLAPEATPMRAYALRTHPILVKYSGWVTLLSKLYPNPYQIRDVAASGMPALRFTSGIASYLTTFRAMNQHHSQMVWFRWLYLLFSSYMWRNDWIEIERQIELQSRRR
jgi:N-acetylglucosaminylphosphatidylinositol deacetylase